MKRFALTVAEFAESLSVHENTIRREISEGKIKAIKIRGCVRVLAPNIGLYLQRLAKEFEEEYGFIPTDNQ